VVLTGRATHHANARTFQEQAFKVLDPDLTGVRHNSEWLDMSMMDLFKLMRIPTVAQLLERTGVINRLLMEGEGPPSIRVVVVVTHLDDVVWSPETDVADSRLLPSGGPVAA